MPGAQTSSLPTWPPRPPADETPEERTRRLNEEVEAKARSDTIDMELAAERDKKKQLGAKILLLGQAESGKSTVLKNFQIQFAPKAFEAEVGAWRPVIHLNLVRSVNFILNLLQTRLVGLRDTLSSGNGTADQEAFKLNADVRRLIFRLSPLRQVEETLNRALSGPVVASNENPTGSPKYNPAKAPEVSVPSGYGWKKAVTGRRSIDATGSNYEANEFGQTRRVLAACGDDIVKLWKDHSVRQALKSADIALEEQPGFFLGDAERVTQKDYRPSPDDILKARVTTVGPEEHVIQDEYGYARHWTIYDVGGSRSQRAAWAQFFDDVNIIIFLAPMSAFNQVLAEDDSVNRLTDSLRLWQTICSNKILEKVELVIFLNKLDILRDKLKSGVQFSQFVTSYTGENEGQSVASYLLSVFVSLHQKHSKSKRKLHPYVTTATASDTAATASVISKIRDKILIGLLSSTDIL